MNETLEHHGILGMKWGVRRYQNKDGTWTKEGKEHRNPSVKDCKKEYNELQKQRNAYYDNYGMDLPEKESKELDSIDERINDLIEGRYSEAVFREYNEKQPELIRNHTGEEVTWKDAFGDSYENTTKGNRHSLVGLVEGGIGQYRFKSRMLGHSDESEEDVTSDTSTEDSLMHYGVKGQSWGKRNYQFEDGTLTEEGKERYSTSSGGVRGRRRTTNTTQGEDVHKTESINQGKAPQMTQQVTQSTTAHAHDLPTGKKNNMMSDDEYTKTKQELAKRDFVQVYDGKMGKMIYVKKDEFRDHIRRLADQGIEVKMPYLDSSDTSEESMADIRTKNAEVRYWNELVEKAQSQTYAGPESEGLHTREDQKAARDAMAERREKARIEAEQKKARLEDNRKRTTSVAHSDDSSEDILEHHGILGMKWGIRRYQNADGSLTAAGRKRYGVDENDGQRSSSGPSSGDSSNSITRTPAKSASEMTDQELSQALNRLRMEQQYNELTGAKSSNQYQNQQNFSTPPSNTGNLSNAELQAYITRLDMEKRYKQLTSPPPKELTVGQKFVKEVLPAVVLEVGKEIVKNSLKKAFGLNGDGNNNNSNNNNGGKKNNNDDSQYKSLKKELNDLKSMMGSQRKQDSGGNQKRESSRDSESSSSLPEPQRNDRRDSIFSAARDAARNAREQRREQQRQERAQKRENDRLYRDTFAEVRRNVRDYQKQEREERRRQSLIDTNRRVRDQQNRWSSVSAFLSGLERQNGIQYTSKAEDYRTSGEKYLDDYIARMGR